LELSKSVGLGCAEGNGVIEELVLALRAVILCEGWGGNEAQRNEQGE
jgi:hypothetical protein